MSGHHRSVSSAEAPLERGRLHFTEIDHVDLTLRAGEENFPVALRFLPRIFREDLSAVYAFARGVDEIGDGGRGTPAQRIERLRRLDAELARIWSGGTITDPVLLRLRRTVTAHRLPSEPFHRLVRANIQDQQTHRYPTFEDLLGYCRLSANPVGRIVLGVFEQANADEDGPLTALSDKVCTALQLLEHWQDVGEDARAGRIYLPQQDLTSAGVRESDLTATSATPQLAALMRTEISRAADLLAEGRPLVRRLQGWARPSVAGFVAGGEATVAALRRTHGDVLTRPARPSRAGTAARMVALLARGGGR